MLTLPGINARGFLFHPVGLPDGAPACRAIYHGRTTTMRNDIHWTEIILPDEIVSIARQMGISFDEAQEKLDDVYWREYDERGLRHYCTEIDGWKLTGWKAQNYPGIFVVVEKAETA
jgi:hypothetical protein